MFCLTREERLGYEQWEVSILYARLLEHGVELMLHLLPYCVSIRFDDHASAYCRLLCEVSFHYQVVVPLTVVVSPFGEFF